MKFGEIPRCCKQIVDLDTEAQTREREGGEIEREEERGIERGEERGIETEEREGRQRDWRDSPCEVWRNSTLLQANCRLRH